MREPRAVQTDQHHVFPQEHIDWFTQRGVDVHDFTIDISLPEHGAQHGGGDWRQARERWNSEIMRLLNAAERNKQAIQGATARLSPREIMQVGQRLMARRGLGGLAFHRYLVNGQPV